MIRAATAALLAALLPAAPVWAESHEDVIVSHGYSNFGELKYGPDAVLDYVNPDAPKGGEISIWAQGNFDSFNPYTRKGVPASSTGLLYESMLVAAADDPYGAYCYLCTTLEYPESRDWVIFNLREDVRFSDGTPMTADDVFFTNEIFLEQGIAEYRNAVGGIIESVEVLGPYRIRFDFSEDAPRRDAIGIAAPSIVLSRAEFEEKGLRIDESTDVPFMGTGPYVLGDVDIGRSLEYVRDEDWWGADLPWNRGRNNFDTVRIEYFADSAAALEGFKAGVYTFRNENSSKEWATSYDFPAVQDGHVIVEELPDGSIGSGQAFVFNLNKPEWQDPRVREAMALLFNFEWSNETLFYGLYERTQGFFDNSDLAASGAPTEAEAAILQPLVDDGLLDASILSDEVRVPAVNDASTNTPNRRILRQALGLLEEAGYSVGSDGLARNADGEVLSAVILQTSPAFDRIVNPFVENLRRVGIDAKLERVDIAQYIERRRSGDWDLTNHGLGQGFEPGIGLRQWFSSTTADDSSRNLMALRSEGIDRLVETVIGAETEEELRDAARALDRALRAEAFWIPQWFKDVHTVAYWDQYDYPKPLPPLIAASPTGLAIDFWWYDAEAAQALRDAGAL